MPDEFDVEAMISRFQARAKAVNPLPAPVDWAPELVAELAGQPDGGPELADAVAD